MKNPGARCRDCKIKYAQEMGLCRSCQKLRIGTTGGLFVLKDLVSAAAAKGLTVFFEDGAYRLTRRGTVVYHPSKLEEAARFVREYLPYVADDEQPF